jgi:hypothetical protein
MSQNKKQQRFCHQELTESFSHFKSDHQHPLCSPILKSELAPVPGTKTKNKGAANNR